MGQSEEITNKIRRVASRVDFRRLSGVRSVLGIALEPGAAYVVELKRRGNPLDSLSGRIEPVKWFRADLNVESPEESGSALKDALLHFGTGTTYAAICARGARFASATIPPEVENTYEWVGENAARLLHLPVAPSELMFHVDVVGTDASGQRALFTFIRKGEVEYCVKLATSAGLHLLSITPGILDLIPVCALSQTEKLPPRYVIAHFSQNTLTTLSCEGSYVCEVKTEHTAAKLSLPEVLEKTSVFHDDADIKVFVSGAFEKSQSDHVLIRPFGLSSDYALASGLAVRGMLPGGGSADFLPQGQRDALDLDLSKSLFRRTVLSSGLVLFSALAIPLGLSLFLTMRSDQLDEAIAATGPSVREIEAMQREVSALKESSMDFASPESRSNSSFILHELAKLKPKTIELLSLIFQADGPSLDIKGEGESERDISELMRNFKNSPLCRELSLKRLNTGGIVGGATHAREGRVYFELTVQINRAGGI